MNMGVTVEARGPLFDGAAPGIIRDWLDLVKQDVADEGVRRLRAVRMNKTGRGTGHYQAEIRTTRVGAGDIRIDNPVVYGPWLEGVSQRNESTRFKGYKLWRKTRQSLQADAADIAEKRMPELVAKLGGGAP